MPTIRSQGYYGNDLRAFLHVEVRIRVACLHTIVPPVFNWMTPPATSMKSSMSNFRRSSLISCAGVLLLLYFDKLKLHFWTIAGIAASVFILDRFLTGNFSMSSGYPASCFSSDSGVISEISSKHRNSLRCVYRSLANSAGSFAVGLRDSNPALFFLLSLSLIGLSAFLMWHLTKNRFLKRAFRITDKLPIRQAHRDTGASPPLEP